MAQLSLEGTLKMEDRSMVGALHRISQGLHGLVSSLEEFREVETMLGLESAAEADYSAFDDSHTSYGSPSFLGVVAGTLKEMVGKLVLDIEAKLEIQKLLLVIQKSVSGAADDGVFLPDAMISKKPSFCVVGTLALGETESVCISDVDSRTVGRAAVERAVTCSHSCEHHPKVMDPYLWSTLPEELVQLVFARLPVGKIIDVCAHSMTWSTMSRSSNFRRVFFERHPQLFGLVGLDKAGERLRNVVYDINSNEWINRNLSDFPWAVDIITSTKIMYACDGGLVCFVPQADLSYPILVGNPLTDEWKALPCIPFVKEETIMVQLVMEEDTKCYRVILVCSGEFEDSDYAAHCYESKTGVWSCMESGLFYGGRFVTLFSTRLDDPRVFDCRAKTMYELRRCSALGGVDATGYAMVKDRLYRLREFYSSPGVAKSFKVSEYAWQSSSSDLSIINSTAPEYIPSKYSTHLFASGGYFLVFADNCGVDDHQHQLIRLYDSSVNRCHCLPMGDDVRFNVDELEGVFMCELRWDAVP